MTVTANADGVITASFTIPANVPSGKKRVAVVGNGGSFGETFFEGRGELWQQTNHTTTTQTTITNTLTTNYYHAGYPYYPWYYGWYSWRRWKWGATPYWYWGYWGYGWYDPLAQTFRPTESGQIAGVELFVRAKGNTPVQVQIRRTNNGFPTADVLTAVEKESADLAVNQWNTWEFPEPIYLDANEEYALTVLCNDADSELAIAELSKWDSAAGRWITTQPYTVGVLLSSSNTSTWTAHQEKDLAFRLLKPIYAVTTKDITLGTVEVTNATDLMLVAENFLPSSASYIAYSATLPNGTTVQIKPQEGMQLAAPITGTVLIKARLNGTASETPVLAPGCQLIVGTLLTSANYISRAIPAGNNSRIVLIVDVAISGEATLVAQWKGMDSGDVWTSFAAATVKALSNDWAEMTWTATGVNEEMVQVQLLLTGTTTDRPIASNLRLYST